MDDEGLDLKVSLADIYGFNYHIIINIIIFITDFPSRISTHTQD